MCTWIHPLPLPKQIIKTVKGCRPRQPFFHFLIAYGLTIVLSWISCAPAGLPRLSRSHTDTPSGSAWYQSLLKYTPAQRDSVVLEAWKQGYMPSFLNQWKKVKLVGVDSMNHPFRLSFWVSQDYLSLGKRDDFFRMPVTRMTAEQIAAYHQSILPTRKMVDLIYEQSQVKLEPIPLLALRDSLPSFYHHHLIIEGQRKNRKGLLAGIKKDIVQADSMETAKYQSKIAIYGWHRLDGKPIQPLYKKHSARYVDYSHGVRLVFGRIKLNGKWKEWSNLIQNPQTRALLWDE